jgi:hypothetical protein
MLKLGRAEVTSHVDHTMSVGRMKEMLAPCGVCSPKFFEESRWTYVALPPSFMNFKDVCALRYFFYPKWLKKQINP